MGKILRKEPYCFEKIGSVSYEARTESQDAAYNRIIFVTCQCSHVMNHGWYVFAFLTDRLHNQDHLLDPQERFNIGSFKLLEISQTRMIKTSMPQLFDFLSNFQAIINDVPCYGIWFGTGFPPNFSSKKFAHSSTRTRAPSVDWAHKPVVLTTELKRLAG